MIDHAAQNGPDMVSCVSVYMCVCAEMVWLCCDYGDFRIYAYGTDEVYKNFGKEFLLLSSSHRGDLDWVAGFVLGARYRFLHVRVHVNVACMWHACGMHVACMWHACGVYVGMNVASMWHPCGIHVASMWHPCDVNMSVLIPPQSIRSLPKQSVRYVPGFGQLLWMLEYPFLARNNYQKDKETIANIAQIYKSYPFPIQVSLHVLLMMRWRV